MQRVSGSTGSGAGRGGSAGDLVSLSVHGPSGVLDLQVPTGAAMLDVATEYSRQARLPSIPALYTRLGELVASDLTLSGAGLRAGSVLVALPAGTAPPGQRVRGRPVAEAMGGLPRLRPGPLSVLWVAVASAGAVLAGVLAAGLPDGDLRRVAIGLLVGTAAVSAVPLGPLAAHRALAAPAFGGAAGLALAWDAEPARLPTVLGIAALTAGLTAAVARALDSHAEEGLRVWTIAGVLVFLVTTGAALVGAPAQLVWALLLLLAMLAARFVPLVSIDVPDQFLIDLERLAVTAWSARERPTGRRGRIVVPRAAVEQVAAGGTRVVTAACVAVLVVAPVSAVLLLREATATIDAVGARCEVGLVGAALLLAARSYRHAAARSLLRGAALLCWAALAVVLFDVMGPDATAAVTAVSIALGCLLVLVSVALGRGWRSAWWARRAEVAESIAGSLAFGSVVVAAGLFRDLWNLTG